MGWSSAIRTRRGRSSGPVSGTNPPGVRRRRCHPMLAHRPKPGTAPAPRPPGGAMADHRTPPADPHAERARAVRMIVALAGCLLALGWLWAARAGHPSDGTVVSTASHAWHPGAVVVADAVGAGNPLRAGDLVTAVDGRTLTPAAPHGQAPRTGDEVTYDVTRDGSPIRVPVTLTDYPFWTLVAHHAATLPYVAMAMLLGSLLVARRPRDPAAIALYSLGVLQFIGYASSLWYGTQVIDVATGRMWVTTVAEVANCLVW